MSKPKTKKRIKKKAMPATALGYEAVMRAIHAIEFGMHESVSQLVATQKEIKSHLIKADESTNLIRLEFDRVKNAIARCDAIMISFCQRLARIEEEMGIHYEDPVQSEAEDDEIERLRARVAELEDIIAGKRPLIDGVES